MSLVKKQYHDQDQDILNVGCYGKIKTLSIKFNAMVGRLFENDIRLRELFTEEELKEAKEYPYIVHYADKTKPWNDPSMPMAYFWWTYGTMLKCMLPENTRTLLENWYKKVTQKDLDLDFPQTYNEKIQWQKLYDSTPLKTKLADKFLVRERVKSIIGKKYLIPLLGLYDKFDEISFEELPKQFVIKCNHGCGYNIIVKDKANFDQAKAREKINKWMNENFAFRAGFELQYKNIPHKIIIEKYIENKIAQDLYDYKFWCFNGKVKYIQFISERNKSGLRMAFYDRDWNKQSFFYSHPLDEKVIEKPNNLNIMISLAEKLSKGFSHVRVDFYRLDDGTILFGEMTFTSASGIGRWNTKKIDMELGKLIKLPSSAYNINTKHYYRYLKEHQEHKLQLRNILKQLFNIQKTNKGIQINLLGIKIRQTINKQPKKALTYYRYKILSKIMIGKKRDKYEKKYKDLKQKIRAIRNFNKGI